MELEISILFQHTVAPSLWGLKWWFLISWLQAPITNNGSSAQEDRSLLVKRPQGNKFPVITQLPDQDPRESLPFFSTNQPLRPGPCPWAAGPHWSWPLTSVMAFLCPDSLHLHLAVQWDPHRCNLWMQLCFRTGWVERGYKKYQSLSLNAVISKHKFLLSQGSKSLRLHNKLIIEILVNVIISIHVGFFFLLHLSTCASCREIRTVV